MGQERFQWHRTARVLWRHMIRDQISQGAVYFVACTLIPAALLAVVGLWTWQDASSNAQARAERMAVTVAEHARRILETQETALEAALARVRGMERHVIAGDRGVHEFLASLESNAHSSSAISIVDVDTARILATSSTFPAFSADLSQRDYLSAHRSAAGGTTYIGEVVLGAASGKVGFTVSKRDPKSGLIAITLVPRDQFLKFYAEAREGSRDVLTLAREDGAALVIRTTATPIGYRLPKDSVFLRYLRDGVRLPVEAPSAVDGITRIWQIARVEGYPVYALYGLDTTRVQSDWRRRIAPLALLTALGSLLLIATGLRTERAVAARQRAEANAEWARQRATQAEALQAKTAQLESLLTSAPLGLAFFDRGHHYVQVNEELARINGIPAGAHLGRRIEDLLRVNAPSVGPMIDHVFASRRAIDGREVSGETPREPGVMRYWLSGFYPVLDPRGEPMLVGAWVIEITERKRAEMRLRASEERFRLFIEHAPAAIAMLDRDLRYIAVSRRWRVRYRLADEEPVAGRALAEVFARAGESWDVVCRRCLQGAVETSEGEQVTRGDGSAQWIAWEVRPWRESDGTIGGLMLITQDITERKTREEHVRLLMREVNHRGKNMLALVQAIARQTAASDSGDFARRFTERIQALAANQDLLVKSEWQGVALDQLVRSQLAHFQDVVDSRIRIEGPPLRISASAAQAIGMALHELATNAGKYGALSNDTGQIEIRWRLEPAAPGAGPCFHLAWKESGGPPVTMPARHGFGSTVVTSMVRLALNADVELDYAPDGVSWNIDCPADGVLEPREGRARPAVTTAAPQAAPADRNRVLIVEDDPLLATEMAEVLQEAGFDVLGPALTLLQAHELLEDATCDAAVLDVNVGSETSEPIAAELRDKGTPFLTVSGASRDHQPNVLRSAPAVTKPLKKERLIAEIKRLLAA